MTRSNNDDDDDHRAAMPGGFASPASPGRAMQRPSGCLDRLLERVAIVRNSRFPSARSRLPLVLLPEPLFPGLIRRVPGWALRQWFHDHRSLDIMPQVLVLSGPLIERASADDVLMGTRALVFGEDDGYVVLGIERRRIGPWDGQPWPMRPASVVVEEEPCTPTAAEQHDIEQVRQQALARLADAPPSIRDVLTNVQDPGPLAWLIAANLPCGPEKQQRILELDDPMARIRAAQMLLDDDVDA